MASPSASATSMAVDDLDLAIDDGEFMVLLGPSGCGKTTALRMIAGLEDITDGRRCAIGDRVVNDVEPKDRDIAMVFQSYALYPHMTVRAEHRVPARPQATRRRLDERRKLTRPSATSASPRPPGCSASSRTSTASPAQLSGGQRQRVALARAIVRRPAGVPHGRAAVEPRRQAAGPDPRRAGRAPPAARRPPSSTSPTTRSRP